MEGFALEQDTADETPAGLTGGTPGLLCDGCDHFMNPDLQSRMTIIIPAWNAAIYIAAVLESALVQITSAHEVVVVDDGSTDATAEICGRYSRARLVHQANSGVSVARNHGARLTTAEWMLFLDSDDILLPHALKALLAVAVANPGAGVVYGRVLMRGRTAAETRLHGHSSAAGIPPHPARANFCRSVLSTPGAALVRRSLFDAVGGFVAGYEPMEDRDFWVKCGLLAPFAFCDTVVLDKTFREGAAHTQTARRITRGLQSQLALASWCEERGLDWGTLGETPATCVNRALREAVWYRCPEVIPGLLEEARRQGVRSIAGARAWIAWQAAKLQRHTAL